MSSADIESDARTWTSTVEIPAGTFFFDKSWRMVFKSTDDPAEVQFWSRDGHGEVMEVWAPFLKPPFVEVVVEGMGRQGVSEFESVPEVYTEQDLLKDFEAALRGNPDVWWKVPETVRVYGGAGDWRGNAISPRVGTIGVIESFHLDGRHFVKYFGEWEELRREFNNYQRAAKCNEAFKWERFIDVGGGRREGVSWVHEPKVDVWDSVPKKNRRWWM